MKGLLMLLGGVAGCGGSRPVYGMVDASYGMPSCFDDSDCQDRGAGWYCDKASGWAACRHGEPDAGTSEPGDAGTSTDSGR
ncbi:MAG TPA: hypothetical protein VGK67_17700 [Myxococcales bacterium]